jgi:Tannase and feruloyl esterase
MQNEGKAPGQCKFQAFINASIALCDGLDGVEDGIISNFQDCHSDLFTLVGQQVVCDGTCITIDYEAAKIVSKIYQGPIAPNGNRLWYSLNTGTGFNGMYSSCKRYFPLCWISYEWHNSDDFLSKCLSSCSSYLSSNTDTIAQVPSQA